MAIEGLQGRGRFEHAAAAGTEHVPGHVEDAEPRRMDERADRRFLVEAVRGGEGERVDAVERPVRARMAVGASSVKKGETLIDTAMTLNAMRPDILRRTPSVCDGRAPW